MDCGRRLKELRENKKMSIYKLSQISGISQGHISDLENGKNQPTIDTLKRLLEPMGITLSDFLMKIQIPLHLTNVKEKLLKISECCPQKKQSFICSLASR